ncbi:hypothetical protein Pst134EA_007719 [Puccinia striiformis f. sp. tritici]|uniref:hypothetical protein n=1 Tax=Puccinia striiformis f. sp. tritici TaxID=168172 RepID=UPI00200744CC|nr:hypothetical protein Pst134EA_007719 [Puccinia striiformis f. sp. tritici]KAH9470467.1 hypothetical protein Pst134EA_007719 [Puccinia striiformis f. sp. tritici]
MVWGLFSHFLLCSASSAPPCSLFKHRPLPILRCCCCCCLFSLAHDNIIISTPSIHTTTKERLILKPISPHSPNQTVPPNIPISLLTSASPRPNAQAYLNKYLSFRLSAISLLPFDRLDISPTTPGPLTSLRTNPFDSRFLSPASLPDTSSLAALTTSQAPHPRSVHPYSLAQPRISPAYSYHTYPRTSPSLLVS